MTKSLPPKSLVLYADDDDDDQYLLREVFDELSPVIELITFENGLALLNHLDAIKPLEPQPCLVILDINMAVMNGKQTLKILRDSEAHKDVPVVLFSTSTMPADQAFAESYNAGYITKPLHINQIKSLLDRMIAYCTDEAKQKIKTQRGY